MSHFCVLVIGGNVDEQLAPYMENCCAEPDKKYMEFHDQEEEFLKEYETGSTERIVVEGNELLAPWDERFRKPGTFGTGSNTHVVPEKYVRREVPFSEMYSTFDEFCQDWHGRKERDKEKNRYGYWQNPNAKWDWFVIGGRYRGRLKLKDGSTSDSALKRDINFRYIRAEKEAKAMKDWESFHSYLNGMKIHGWNEFREQFKDIEEARKAYHELPAYKAIQLWIKETYQYPLVEWDDLASMTREDYVTQAGESSFSAFAVVKGGKWYGRGEMGWWGCVSNEKEKSKWTTEFNKLVSELPDDTELTIVDCHI